MGTEHTFFTSPGRGDTLSTARQWYELQWEPSPAEPEAARSRATLLAVLSIEGRM